MSQPINIAMIDPPSPANNPLAGSGISQKPKIAGKTAIAANIPFSHFLLKNPANRRYLLIALAGLFLQFVLFKFLYPFPDFFSDSYSYIFAASEHLNVSIWPIGYSKLLAAIHSLTHSDTAVVSFQYFLLAISFLYLFFSVSYFFNPGKKARNFLFIFLFFNPLFLYLSNYINSDPLFASLSTFWVTQLIWIIYRPKNYYIITHGVLLFLAFSVRNNAYYYPLISAIAFLLSRQRLLPKLIGIAFPLLLIGAFINQTREAAYDLTGTRQFSLFTGWQLANNALYMYSHIQVDSNQLPTAAGKELDRLSRAFYKKQPSDFYYSLLGYDANFFIREPESPLKQYFIDKYHPKGQYETVVAWGKVSAIFADYGGWLLKRYPIQYARYFMLLNTKNFFFPPLEKLEEYNLGQDNVWPVAQDWFAYKTPTVTSVSSSMQGTILSFYPSFFLFINVLLVGGLLWLFSRRRQIHISRELRSVLYLLSGLLVVNFCFCVFATIIVMRYQVFPMIITLLLFLLILDVLDKTDNKVSKPILTK